MPVTARDVDILKILSSGPSTSAQIRGLMKTVYGHEMSASVLCDRLAALRKDAFVASGDYLDRSKFGIKGERKVVKGEVKGAKAKAITKFHNKWHHRLYALAPASLEVLVKEGFSRDKVRLGLPSPAMVTHELMVTDAVRSIKKEAAVLNYQYRIYDDRMIKASDINKMYGSVPDLGVMVKFIQNGQYQTRIAAIEIDNDTETPATVLRKILNHKVEPIVVFLCKTPMRISDLVGVLSAQKSVIHYMLQDQRAHPSEPPKVLLAILTDFCTNGFFDTEFRNAAGKIDYLMPRGKISPYVEPIR